MESVLIELQIEPYPV